MGLNASAAVMYYSCYIPQFVCASACDGASACSRKKEIEAEVVFVRSAALLTSLWPELKPPSTLGWFPGATTGASLSCCMAEWLPTATEEIKHYHTCGLVFSPNCQVYFNLRSHC